MIDVLFALLFLIAGQVGQTAEFCFQSAVIRSLVQETVRTREPKCQLKAKRESRSGYTYYEWDCEGESVSALISTHPSIKRATEVFKALPNTFAENGLRMRVKQRNGATGLGDENYFWEDDLNSALTGVDFRSKCVVVHVGTRSAKRAFQFARLIADAIARQD